MIIEWLLDLALSIVEWIFSLFGGIQIPGNIRNPSGALGSLFSQIGSLGVWVPWGVISVCVVSVLGVWGIMFLVKVIRQFIAHVPQFGGAG